MPSTPWRTAVLDYARSCRAVRPLPWRAHLSAENEARCRILGGSLMSWLQEEFPEIIRQQQAMRLRQPDDPFPLVVILTEMVGLVATAEIIGESDEMVSLLPDEFARWEGALQDPNCAWHIRYWSAFHPVDDADWTKLIADGLDGIERAQARWHIVGCRWGRQAGHEETHLWEWTGAEMALLAPGYRDVVY